MLLCHLWAVERAGFLCHCHDGFPGNILAVANRNSEWHNERMSSTKDSSPSPSAGTVLYIGVSLIYCFLKIFAGYIGIKYSAGVYGPYLAVVAIALTFLPFLRFSFPIALGAFFGALNVWDWDWPWALAFATPGIISSIREVIYQKRDMVQFDGRPDFHTEIRYARQIIADAGKNYRLIAIVFISVMVSVCYLDCEYSAQLIKVRDKRALDRFLYDFMKQNPASFSAPTLAPTPIQASTPQPRSTELPRASATPTPYATLAEEYADLNRRRQSLDNGNPEAVKAFSLDVEDYNRRANAAKAQAGR